MSRADGLKQAKKILGDIEDKIIESYCGRVFYGSNILRYIESFEHCGNILQGKIKGNVIPPGKLLIFLLMVLCWRRGGRSVFAAKCLEEKPSVAILSHESQ